VRVVIAEDHVLLRDGLTHVLQTYGCTVVAAVEDTAQLTEAVLAQRPDIVIVDIRLPPTFTDEGLRAAIELRRAIPGLPVLILSQYVERLYARELLSDRAGAVGYLLKDRVSEVRQFIDTVRRVAAGGTVMDPEMVAQLLSGHDQLATLTCREREVLKLMAEGRSNAAIASRLTVTERAVSKHINSIFTKLNLPVSDEDNRRVLAVLAYLDRWTGI
jgi:DNA-binding NarL/FixJ family response regulator